MKTCIIYLRVSREKNGEKELSITSQLEQCEQKAEALNSRVLKVFSDRDKSGRKNTRPGYQQAIHYCESVKVDYFIVWSTSRFARNIIDAKNDKLRLDKVGTKVKYVTLDFEDDTNAGFLILTMSEVIDEYQSRQIGADTKRSMMKNAVDGYFNGGHVSFGFIVIQDIHDPKKKRLSVDIDEAVIVKKIFTMRSNGLGGKSIADVLNKDGILYRSNPWTKTRVTSLLRNEKVIGISSFNKKNHEKIKQPKEQWVRVKSHDEIISQTLWDKVQLMMNNAINPQEHGSPKSTWLFTGLIKCGCCQLNLKIISGKGRSKRYYYYACPNTKSGLGCSLKPISSEKLDNWLINELQSLIFTAKNIKTITDELNKASKNWSKEKQQLTIKAEKEVVQLQNKTDKLYDYIESDSSSVNPNDIFPRISSNNKKIEKIKAQLDKLNASYSPKNMDIKPTELSEFLTEKIINGADPKSKRLLIRSFIQGLAIIDGKLNIEYNPAALINSGLLLVPNKRNWLLELGSNQRQTD